MNDLDLRERDFRNEDGKWVAYFPGSNIAMYQLSMGPVGEDSGYRMGKRFLINRLREGSGFCSIVNEDVLNDRTGSAAMIDYALANKLHGTLDGVFMGGSVDSIRFRSDNVIKTVNNIAKEKIEENDEVRIYEAGCGFGMVALHLVKYLKGEGYNPNVHYLGVDKQPEVVEVANNIVGEVESRYPELGGLSKKIKVREGDALEELRKEGEFDVILAEGTMEYWNDGYRNGFSQEVLGHLSKGGYFISTATHVIPKKRIAQFLGLYFPPMPEVDYISMYTGNGFGNPDLIRTEPPNISIGIGKKT